MPPEICTAPPLREETRRAHSGNYSFQVIHIFGKTGQSYYPVVLDPSGNLIGVAFGGTADLAGFVFKLTHSGSAWDYSVLHGFDQQRIWTQRSDGCPLGQPIRRYKRRRSCRLFEREWLWSCVRTHKSIIGRELQKEQSREFRLLPAFDCELLSFFHRFACHDEIVYPLPSRHCVPAGTLVTSRLGPANTSAPHATTAIRRRRSRFLLQWQCIPFHLLRTPSGRRRRRLPFGSARGA